jgi:hypothetical protein
MTTPKRPDCGNVATSGIDGGYTEIHCDEPADFLVEGRPRCTAHAYEHSPSGYDLVALHKDAIPAFVEQVEGAGRLRAARKQVRELRATIDALRKQMGQAVTPWIDVAPLEPN